MFRTKYPGLITKGRVLQMRYLNLDAQHFDILYNNLLNGGNGLDIKQVRLHGKILDKLESFGNAQDDGSYKYNETKGAVLALEDAEYKLGKEINDNTKYNPRFSREAIKYLDWYDNAPTKPIMQVTNAAEAAAEATN